MKKIIIMSIALGLAGMTQAATQPISLVYQGMLTEVPGALAHNGYIATHWFGTDASDLRMVSASAMVDAYNDLYSDTFDGLGWIDSVAVVTANTSTTYYAATRVFQYSPGTLIGDYDSEWPAAGDGIRIESLSLETLSSFWTLIQGTDVMQGEVTGYFVTPSDGTNATPSINYAANMVLAGIPDTPAPAVPEPSTYAALAGLAILAYAAVRRRK
ncbi:putative globular PEP-CTERM protein [Geminisphaera colitermitum]|uniref:putative globular PEP-CTERM protein n=1 Tax=Geminisphaera colitermitum TaxID=1148786 RepID=UPI000158CF86|nr:putative globular PEP-CTERM protein [Geminisphaera colitermitum]